MMKNIILLAFVILFSEAKSLLSQTILLQNIPAKKSTLNLEYLHPSFDSDVDYSLLSGAYNLQANIRLSNNLYMSAALPFINYAPSETNSVYPYKPESESGIGNLFLAIQPIMKQDSGRMHTATIGVALPTAATDNRYLHYYGSSIDFYNNHYYLPDILTFYSNIAIYGFSESGAFYGFEIGPRILLPTGSNDTEDTEFMLHYGLTGGIKGGVMMLQIEFSGLIFLSSQADSFSDRMFHTLALGLRYTKGNFNPGIFYRVYLEERLSNRVNGVLGISLVMQVN
jgi:hypothetical protein